MRRIAITALVTSLTSFGGISPAAEAMSAYRWTKRPLVIVAPDATSRSLAEQRSIISANRAGLAERDVVIIVVAGEQVTSELGARPAMSAAALRSRFGVPRDAFRTILVGKDGGAKLSSTRPLAASTLFRTIDAMPMRAEEMRRR